jgi:SPP1 gp7 family putative phage head morphogenesis protein
MYTDEQLEELEQEERVITEEAIVAMIFILHGLKSDLEREVRSFYQKYGKDGVVTYQEARKWVSEKDHRKRINVLYGIIGLGFANTLNDMSKEFENFLKGVITKESEFFDVALEIEKFLKAKWGIDDLTWLERLINDVEVWNKHVANDLKTSMLQRKHIEDVIEQLDDRFTTMEKVLYTLAITESTGIGSLAREVICRELGAKKYRFYARADERTCEHCGALHGKVFPMTAYEVGVTASPIHPRCRCWEVPVID